MNKFTKFGLTLRQFLFLFSAVLLIVILLQLRNLNETKNTAVQYELDETYQVTEMINRCINDWMTNVRGTMLVMSGRKDIFTGDNTEEITAFLENYARMNANLIRAIYIKQNNGTILSSKSTLYKIRGNETLKELMGEWSDFHGGIWWSEPYQSNVSGETVAFGFPVSQAYQNYSGMIVVEINIEYLHSQIKTVIPGNNISYALLSREGNSIVFENPSDMIKTETGHFPLEIEFSQLQEMAGSKNGQWIYSENNHSLKWLKSNRNNLNWQVVIIRNKDIVNDTMKNIYLTFYLNLLLYIILIAVGTFGLSFYFNAPIRRIASKLDKIRDLNHLKEIDVKKQDELGRLVESFNLMIKRIHFVEKKNKEYELKMLQSQIGPHFLYNTLACVDSLAKQNQLEEVNQTIKSLIRLLSYSFDKTADMVLLEDELNCLDSYITIQKVRYGDIFDYSTDVSEEIRHNKVLKLTLQPFVENAIFHGLAPKKERGLVKIKAFERNNKLIIVIKDNGVGMDRATCRSVLQQKQGKKLHDRFSSIGIANVHERIRINFGEKSGIRISSLPGKGTIVIITMQKD